MTSLIRGKVAKILNSRELVFNIGSNTGVEIGMKFDVLDPKGENITDPDTSEILGSIEKPKVRVKITKVYDKLSIASTYKKTKVNVGGDASLLSSVALFSRSLMPPKWVTKYETLKTDESTWENLDEEGSFVKTGDPIVQVLVDEDEDEE